MCVGSACCHVQCLLLICAVCAGENSLNQARVKVGLGSRHCKTVVQWTVIRSAESFVSLVP